MSQTKAQLVSGTTAQDLTVDNINTTSINSGQVSGRKNLIINGAMQVAQRGTSGTSVGYVSLDRWYLNLSGGSATFSQETNPNPSETTGIQKFARLNVSSSSDFTSIRQRIEDVTKVPSGTVTLSFYAKGTAPAGGLYAFTEQNFGTGGSSSVDGTPVLITSSLTSSWVRYTAQITVDSIDGKTIGSASFFQIVIGQYSNSSSTAYDLNITGVQLEVGSTATDFEHRSFADELLRCYRYFQILSSNTSGGLNAHSRYPILGNGSNSAIWYAYHKATMRVKPSLVKSGISASTMDIYNYSTSATATFNNMTIAEGDENHSQLLCTTTNNFAIAQIGSWRWSVNADCYFAVNSEL